MKLDKDELRDIYKKLIVVLGGILFYYAIFNFKDVTSIFSRYMTYVRPIIIGFAIAFIVNMIMDVFELFFRKSIGLKDENKIRIYSMLLAYIVVFMILTFFISVILPKFINSLISLVNQLPTLITSGVEKFKTLPIPDKMVTQLNEFVNKIEINNLIEKFGNEIMKRGGFMLQGTLSIVGTIFSSFFEAFLAISFSAYILSAKEQLKRNSKQVLYSFIPEKISDTIVRYSYILYKNFYNFFTGQFIEAFLLGIVVFIGISVIGSPYGLILGVTSGLLNLIPYFGAVFGAIISTTLIAITDPIKGLIFLVFILVYQQIDGNYIYPKLVGSRVGIPALWIMAAITFGGAIMGAIGMVIFVPIVATLYMIVREITHKKLKEKKIDISKK